MRDCRLVVMLCLKHNDGVTSLYGRVIVLADKVMFLDDRVMYLDDGAMHFDGMMMDLAVGRIHFCMICRYVGATVLF